MAEFDVRAIDNDADLADNFTETDLGFFGPNVPGRSLSPLPIFVKHLNEDESSVSGTGNFSPILRVNGDKTLLGFNTDENINAGAQKAADLDIDNSWTNSIRLGDIPIVYLDLDGDGEVEAYREFRLDLNENVNKDVSLEELQIFTSSGQATLTNYRFDDGENLAFRAIDGFNLVFDLDSDADNKLILSDDGAGQGRDDYIFYVPVSQFGDASDDDFVTLFSQFGPQPPDDAGFAEWRVQTASKIEGIKFNDLNGDGVRDEDGADNIAGNEDDEAGLAGFTLYIDQDGDGVRDAFEQSVVSGEDGSFTFSSLLGNTTYSIREDLSASPAGYELTTGDSDGNHQVIVTAAGTYSVEVGNKPNNPELTVVKTVTDVDSRGAAALVTGADQVISYRIAVTNSGNLTLTGLEVLDTLDPTVETVDADTDSYNDGDLNENGVFDVGEEWLFNASYTTTQADIDNNGNYDGPDVGSANDGVIRNVATATSNESAPDDDDATVGVVQDPELTVVKTVTDVDSRGAAALVTGADQVISYRIAVTNSGNLTLTGLEVLDTLDPTVETVDADTDSYNDGDLNENGVFDVGEEWLFNASYTTTQADIDNNGNYDGPDVGSANDGVIRNVATATSNESAPDDDDATVGVVQDPELTVVKTVTDVDSRGAAALVTGADQVISYRIAVTNSGNLTLTGLEVLDTLDPTVETVDADTDSYNDGDLNENGVFDVGEEWLFNASYTTTQADIDNNGNYDGPDVGSANDGVIRNVATATSNESAPDDDDATVGVVRNPLIDLEKLVSVNSTDGINGTFVDADGALGPQNVHIGSDVWFKVTLENKGNVTLTDVDVEDINTTGGEPGTTFDLMVDGALTLNAINNFGATLSGDTDNDKQLDIGETWTITYKQDFDAGNHVNTAFVTTGEGARDNDAAHYFSLINGEGSGVRTPGFWSNLGYTFWDGDPLTLPKQAGKSGFPDGELLYDVDSNNDGVIDEDDEQGLLIGDYNKNGLTDNFGADGIANTADDVQENTLFIDLQDAQKLINASNKTVGGDGRFMLGRDMVATWLNFLADNELGSASDPQSARHYLDDGIDWMQGYSGVGNGDDETFDTFSFGSAIKTNSLKWKGTAESHHSGAEIHTALDNYNNDGTTSSSSMMFAHDADDAAFLSAIGVVSKPDYQMYAHHTDDAAFLPSTNIMSATDYLI